MSIGTTNESQSGFREKNGVSGRRRRESALMRVASTIPSGTDVSASLEAFIARAGTDDLTVIYGLCDLAAAHGDTNDRNSVIPLSIL